MFSSSLISADNHLAVMAALFGIALFGFWAEQKSWGKLITGAVWSILAAIAASNLNIIPKDADTYGFVFKYLVPVLIPLFLIQANVKQILAESGRVGLAFILASIGSAVGAISAATIWDLGEKTPELAGIFTGSYTGGSVNYAALIQATGFDDANIISAATAVDTLLSALFLAVLAILPASHWLMKQFTQRDHSNAEIQQSITGQSITGHPTSGFSLAAAITFAIAVVALSDMLVSQLSHVFDKDLSSLRYIFITALSIIPPTLAPRQMAKLDAGQSLGMVLAFVFFSAIAAGSDIAKLINVAPLLFGFVLTLLLVHALVVFGLGSLLSKALRKLTKNQKAGLSLPELITASNAAILGATTAPALAMARGWPALVTPGILVGVAGYIIGTPLGLLVIALLK